MWEKHLARALVPWEVTFGKLCPWDDPISLSGFQPFALSLWRLFIMWEKMIYVSTPHPKNQKTNSFLLPILKGRGLGKWVSFKIAVHFPLWLETNCCKHRMQNKMEARHKNAVSNRLGYYINRIILSVCETMLKACCIPNHTPFYDDLRQHLALVFHHKCQKINDLN